MSPRVIVLLVCLTIFQLSCGDQDTSPVVDLSSYELLDSSLVLEAVAHEPTIIAPVAIDFDEKGRMWVAEMPDYMPDINGKNESIPAGRIVILEDTDNDGIMDESKVFRDNIHHLRAIKLYRNGILYAGNPTLYFTEIQDDLPAETMVVDSFYALGGNIEHKPNGLLMNIDNCIYNAKSQFRYCYDGTDWSKQVTSFRGQWGITQDENGRLYANDNSNLLFGDNFLPNTVIQNQFLHNPEGINVDLVGDRSIFPAHSTAINRGYTEGALDDQQKVKSTTSACGPHIFLSDGLGNSYYGDAFVCVPEGNLIKHLNLSQNEFKQSASFTSPSREFLTSTDEAFRPVNITTGPNGDLYVVDFHRGIIQHKIYMTKYLKEKIEERQLDKVTNYGRILRIRKKGPPKANLLRNYTSEDSLINYLSNSNPFVRIKAQEHLLSLNSPTVDEKLYKLLFTGSKLSQLHSIWTLAGRGKMDLGKIKKHTFSDPWVIANLFKAASQSNNSNSADDIITLAGQYSSIKSPVVSNHIATSLAKSYDTLPKQHGQMLRKLGEILPSAQISAYPSGQQISAHGRTFDQYNQHATDNVKSQIFRVKKRQQASPGYDLFNQFCASCHGFGGQGMDGLAPPLDGAKLVNGNPAIVPVIILNGLEGDLSVGDEVKSYASVMPSFNLSPEEIEKISNYIYNAFRNDVVNVSSEEVSALLAKYSKRKEIWTEEELLGTDF